MTRFFVRSLIAVSLATASVAACASARGSRGLVDGFPAVDGPAGASTGAASGAADGGSPARPAASDEPIRLRPGDAVRVEVRVDPSLGGQFGVGDDGNVLIPMIGLIPVAGRPFDAVREDVRRAYAGEVADDVIRVTPLVRIAVLGEVMRPGLFPVDPTYTIADVLASVGGFSPLADRGEVVLVRDGESRTISLDPEAPGLFGGLRSGDRIVVGRRSWFEENLAIFVGAAASVAAAAVTSLIVR
ncbi:MAG TPA: polysaccharide biosynthesis/export family protein [Longimicrobiales bacterium]